MSDTLSAFLSTDSVLIGTIIPFLFVLTVVVFVHEMGHYLVGRWCGIGVKAFSIGFGPELIGFNDRRGTRWKLSAIPLGGYVKFVGDMNATSTPDAGEIEALTDEEKKVAFHTQPIWKRALTVFAGPAFNFLLTIAVFAVMFAIYGRFVSEPVVAEVRPDSPAAVAGFLPGDRFVSVDGTPVESFADVQRMVSGRAGDPIVFVLSRNGGEVTLTATPQIMEQTDALGNVVKIGVIGVVNTPGIGPAARCQLHPRRRRRRGGSRNRPYHRAHRPVPEAIRRRARGQVPARRPDQDRQDIRTSRQARFRVAGAACRTAVGRHRGAESFADSAARWRAPRLLRPGGPEGPSGVGARDGSGLSCGAVSGVWPSWRSFSGTTCLDAENMKEFGLDLMRIEAPFTMTGDMRDAKATPLMVK